MPLIPKLLCSIKGNFSLQALGERIIIFGPMASGKSTTAELLSEKLHLPVYHLDQLFFLPNTNWESRSDEDFKKIHDVIVQSDNWIIDGNYIEIFDIRIRRATSVIFMNPSTPHCIYNFYRRFFRKNRQIANYPGRPTEINEKFTIKSLKYIFRFKRNIPKFLRKLHDFKGKEFIYLTSFRQVKQFQNLIKKL